MNVSNGYVMWYVLTIVLYYLHSNEVLSLLIDYYIANYLNKNNK